MLEGLVTWVLNNYLGKYVHLNTHQLSIALLSGKVELENVPLKRNALSQLGWPIQIQTGFIRKVTLKIPVRQLMTAPWEIALEGVYVVASPFSLEEWDHDSEQLLQHDHKISALDNLEAKWRGEKDFQDQSYYASTYLSWYNYGTGYISEILENIQLKINQVHIRYEDSRSIPNKSIAFGVTIETIGASRDDDNDDKHAIEKFKLDAFTLYWMEFAKEQSYEKLSMSELVESMSIPNANKSITNYIVPAVNAIAHVKRNKSLQQLRGSSTPRFICDLVLDNIYLTLVDWQYNQIVACYKGLDNISLLRSYRLYKPVEPVKSNPKAWWYYAVSCFYPGGQPKFCKESASWDSCLLRARQNVAYVQVYKKLLVTPTAALTAAEKKIKDDVEWMRNYEDLRILRQLVMDSVELPPPPARKINQTSGRKMLESWFPQWMGWYSNTSSSSIPEDNSPETMQLEGEILQALAETAAAENNTIFKRDAVFGQFNFCLKKGSISLCTKIEKETCPMVELEFKNLAVTLTSKPRSSSHMIELLLEAVYLKDKSTQDTMFPIIIGPPPVGLDRTVIRNRPSNSNLLDDKQLFHFVYEKKPPYSGCCVDRYRINIKTKCLDVVHQPNVLKWLTHFVCFPHQHELTQNSRIENIKSRTKMELFKNWEQIFKSRTYVKSAWELELDITAPQIICVENFQDQNSAMAVLDFGRMRLKNNISTNLTRPDVRESDDDDDETFLTPCSTPPVSENDSLDSDEFNNFSTLKLLDEIDLHNRIYDCYSLDLSDMQILIAKARDNWRYALNKGTSTMHVVDRFNISLQIERRVVYTSDPMYPSLTLSGNLPKLVVHLNENKISSSRNLLQLIISTGLPSPPFAATTTDDDIIVDDVLASSSLEMMQFTVDQLSLELQSRGRSVAELQVAGIKVAFTKRPVDTSITLTVHSLLLVDALQNFGPDFELLVASHKHVGMDSMSGSIRDSEPTSPTSPATSPTPRVRATSPITLTHALHTLSEQSNWLQNTDTEALIMIEICLVTGTAADPIHIANVQFNNLDIIANQETIVELVGFVKRVFPKTTMQQQRPNVVNLPTRSNVIDSSTESLLIEESGGKTAELTFDFHRLNVLLLRGIVRDGVVYGKKVCTATMAEAKIHATIAEKFQVEGSLGGLQLLDLTPDGQLHPRIISVGKDPLLPPPPPIYHNNSETKAFSFKVVRNLNNDDTAADVTIRMASLWYTHSPMFVLELQSCATEFKQYLANLAKSIKSAATDMALGLVHARAEALAQSLSINKRLPSSIYGSALSFNESSGGGAAAASPNKRRRRKNSSNEPSGCASVGDTQTPDDDDDDDSNFTIDVSLNVELDSPVVVLPRSSSSFKVFVAHLGKIRVSNSNLENATSADAFIYAMNQQQYDIEVRDMNIYSLNTKSRRGGGGIINRPEVLYNCNRNNLAKPILHDTMLQVNVLRRRRRRPRQVEANDDDDDENTMKISGCIVTALKVSLTRSQYEQMLDTVQWLTSSPTLTDLSSHPVLYSLTDIREEGWITGVSTLNMDPHVRATLFSSSLTGAAAVAAPPKNRMTVNINFKVPLFIIQLKGSNDDDQGLIDLSLRDFVFMYDKSDSYKSSIKVSLRSIFMEDLSQCQESRQRSMVISSNSPPPLPRRPPNSRRRSLPDLTRPSPIYSSAPGSLPDHLEVLGLKAEPSTLCCPAPPISRSEKNLVLISTLLVDPLAPNFHTKYNSIQRSTTVDFNCLNMVISVPSWIVVIDFFSGNTLVDYGSNQSLNSLKPNSSSNNNNNKAMTDISVCSLTIVLVKHDRDIARANISNVELSINTQGHHQKQVKGKLGSMSLVDLTLHGQIYRERFLTSDKDEALQFDYIRHAPDAQSNYDAQLQLEMASIMYVHTKRFSAELQAFFNSFTERQGDKVLKSIQAATSSGKLIGGDEPFRLSLVLKAGAPIMLLPVSSKSTSLVIVDLGKLSVTNKFQFSKTTIDDDDDCCCCLLEVMLIELDNMDLYTGIKEDNESMMTSNSFKFGSSSVIMRKGPSFLTNKVQLNIQYERNLHKHIQHSHIPDCSIYGTLSTLELALDLNQYKLIRGLLTYNLGEDTERILPSTPQQQQVSLNKEEEEGKWTLSSMKLNLENVSLNLVKSHSKHSPLACIKFIKSHLTVDSFSNLSQDIDLVSQEILVIDTRFNDEKEENGSNNVFTKILRPIKESKNLVQVEIHSRRRLDHTKLTVLLNNMRLMAIFDWWMALKEYILQEVDNVQSSSINSSLEQPAVASNQSFELKLNVTSSEFVLVEDCSQWDTNAVILKSTTVILYYQPRQQILSCNLSNCEMFSCTLVGVEEYETAAPLSIIDPIMLSVDLLQDGLLEMQLQFLTVRLSYYDFCMFKKMLDSLPKQLLLINNQNDEGQIQKLASMGFKYDDCIQALAVESQLDDAAIWLTQNAKNTTTKTPLTINAVELKSNGISICIIDDCLDSDVPLLELSLSNLEFKHQFDPSSSGDLRCTLAANYFNRVLSGWEPIVEPWTCNLQLNLNKSRITVRIQSDDTINVNITSTFMELYTQVKTNWTAEFFNYSPAKTDVLFRKRSSPFVPFALKNDTGSLLKFITMDGLTTADNNWLVAKPGEIIPFKFVTTRDKLRHQDSYKLKTHQIRIQVNGWDCVEPVTVDKVGIYFRDTPSSQDDTPPARIVFDISLEGSARKLITIRSGLTIINNLTESIEVKLENRLPVDTTSGGWIPTTRFTIQLKSVLAVPLIYAHSQIYIRPIGLAHNYTYHHSSTALIWDQIACNADRMFLLGTCHNHKGHNYKFCGEIVKEKLELVERNNAHPAHKIILYPTLKLVNLLPVDLQFIVAAANYKGIIKPGQYQSMTCVDPDELVQLEVRIENFKSQSKIVIPPGTSSEFSSRVQLQDCNERMLYLTAQVLINRGARIKVNIYAPFWIINKTGIPLVFKQAGSSSMDGAAGQSDEHEQARLVTPLLFSFSDHDAGNSAICARIGKRVVWDGCPQWCSNFHTHKGIQYRKLHVTMRDSNSADRVFTVGIEVRHGRGKYRGTHIISISPRYQLHNRSSYKLLFAQSYLVTDARESMPTIKSFLKALPSSFMSFHWSRLDKEQLLCISIEDIPDCHWSGGFKIDGTNSMHINVRDPNSRVYFLRLEVILQGATNHVVFTDADTMPPPIRIDNFSKVPIKFGQSCFIDRMHSLARAHSSVPYAWDEPTKAPYIKLIAPGGVYRNYDLNNLGSAPELTYENFIYIAFVGTFKKYFSSSSSYRDPHDVQSQELVLDVDQKNRVFLARKMPGQRSQLWRMTSEGYLQHEGSSPPIHPNSSQSQENILVLDIADTAPQPNYQPSKLTLRRVDPRRLSTQRWRFLSNGQLSCNHHNMCVQSANGFYGLREGSGAVLGLPHPVGHHQRTDKGIPIEQAVEFQRLHPGSGKLTVHIRMDGPTHVITIQDAADRTWNSISPQRPLALFSKDDQTFKHQLNLDLKGIGLSIVCRKAPEELLYAHMSDIVSETVITRQSKQFCLSISDVQIDNQLMDATVPVVLYVTPPAAAAGASSRSNEEAAVDRLPALEIKFEILPQVNTNAVIFKHLIVRVKKITTIIEEKLLLKIVAFIGLHSTEEELINNKDDESGDYETHRLIMELSGAGAKRYYFETFKLIPNEIRLSVRTASKLPKPLQRIKKKLGLTLIKFEDAAIVLKPFDRKHPFETSQFLFKSIVKHFKDELMWQAGIILGSIDFIGNPLGLMYDVSEGISGFFLEGNVGALVKNVTHGLSNSAAKVTESLSDGLGKIAMDDYHEEMRQKFKQIESGKSSDHMLAGFKGLGFGLLGGATSIFQQMYEGVVNDGVSGVFLGFGKGVVGAFTKPVVGVLDFASETARAVRDSSRSKLIPERKRLPRCVYGPGGLLPKYDLKQSQGQQFLYAVNNRNYEEKLLAYQVLGNGPDDLLCIVSDRLVRIVTTLKVSEMTPVLECALSDLESCNVKKENESGQSRFYLEIAMRYSGPNSIVVNTEPIKRPKVRCKSMELAEVTAQQINYAKTLYVEKLYTLTTDESITTTED